MIAKHHIPLYPLNQFVESFFYYSGFSLEHAVERFLPDGNIHLLFDLLDGPQYIYDNYTLKKIQACKNVWFSGFRTQPITIPSGRESEMIIVTFHKGKAFPFLSEPISEVTNYVVDAELVLENTILDVRDRLKEAKTVMRKFFLLETHLLKHYRSKLRRNPYVEYAIAKITATPDMCSLKKISDKVGYSHKHLIKLFKDGVGVTPKEFLKVIRFQKVIEEIEQQKEIHWASVALDCGFYDQSHFIADFKSFSGFTPTQYVKQRGENLNYVPVK